jgi:hypothetical protein
MLFEAIGAVSTFDSGSSKFQQTEFHVEKNWVLGGEEKLGERA